MCIFILQAKIWFNDKFNMYCKKSQPATVKQIDSNKFNEPIHLLFD